jgi:hypothetical protein
MTLLMWHENLIFYEISTETGLSAIKLRQVYAFVCTRKEAKVARVRVQAYY